MHLTYGGQNNFEATPYYDHASGPAPIYWQVFAFGALDGAASFNITIDRIGFEYWAPSTGATGPTGPIGPSGSGLGGSVGNTKFAIGGPDGGLQSSIASFQGSTGDWVLNGASDSSLAPLQVIGPPDGGAIQAWEYPDAGVACLISAQGSIACAGTRPPSLLFAANTSAISVGGTTTNWQYTTAQSSGQARFITVTIQQAGTGTGNVVYEMSDSPTGGTVQCSVTETCGFTGQQEITCSGNFTQEGVYLNTVTDGTCTVEPVAGFSVFSLYSN